MFGIIIGSMADLFVNLSAGWFGAAIIVPIYTRKQRTKPWAVVLNIEFGIMSLLAAIILRNQL